jgi:tRNA-dihydrouridine synthase
MARLAEDCGLNAIALHPRTRMSEVRRKSRLGRIAEVKAAVKIPVIGNGESSHRRTRSAWSGKLNCDAVMIGRGASSNPWIFRQIRTVPGHRRLRSAYPPGSLRDDARILRRMLVGADHDAVGKMKQFATYFTHGVRHGAQLRSSIYAVHDSAAILDLVDAFFNTEPVLAQ